MIRGPAFVLALLIVTEDPRLATAQTIESSTSVGVAVSGEHARFTHSLVQPGVSDIAGTQPAVSLRVSRMVTRHVGVGLDVDISRRHELVRQTPF